MNRKRAVRKVLEHTQPEFIPLGTYAIDNDTVERIIGHQTYVRDKAGIKIAYWEGRRDEVVQSLKEDSVELFKKAGVDGYQSLQTTAGMDLRLLKNRYAGELTFWGGVGVETLICGTPEDVRREVRRAMQHAAHNGGFILGPSHSIAYGTRYDNFMALLDEHDKLKQQT